MSSEPNNYEQTLAASNAYMLQKRAAQERAAYEHKLELERMERSAEQARADEVVQKAERSAQDRIAQEFNNRRLTALLESEDFFACSAVYKAVQEMARQIQMQIYGNIKAHLEKTNQVVNLPGELFAVKASFPIERSAYITKQELREALKPIVLQPVVQVSPTPVTVEAPKVSIEVNPEVKLPATREELRVTRDEQGRMSGAVKTVKPIPE